jgi:hypothetical protein
MRRLVFFVVTLAACGSDPVVPPRADAGVPDAAPPSTGWRAVPFTPLLARPALGIAPAGDGTVFFSGGGIGTGRGSLALRYDPAGSGAWSELPFHVDETLWWVWAQSPADAWFVGEGGVAVHWDGTRGEVMHLPVMATLFGVWGCQSNDVWAVGGSPTGPGDDDVLLHWDGTAWTKVPPPEALGVAYLKIWGSGCEDVFVVGQQGVVVHWNGQAWSRMDTGSMVGLTTVHGSGPRDVYAVGGPPATVLHWDGTRWEKADLAWKSAGASGVWVEPGGTAWVVGWNGEAWRRKDGAWVNDTPMDLFDDLHVVWADGRGNAFAGGGGFLAPAGPSTVRRGVVARFGAAVPAGTVAMP